MLVHLRGCLMYCHPPVASFAQGQALGDYWPADLTHNVCQLCASGTYLLMWQSLDISEQGPPEINANMQVVLFAVQGQGYCSTAFEGM